MGTEKADSGYVRIDLGPETYALQFFTPGVNDHTYIVVSQDEAALIDPQRDYRRFLDALDETAATLTAVFETHIHNDYVSGGVAAARQRNARYVLPANCGAQMPHEELPDNESINIGSCQLRAIHTPGHTLHHTSYALEHGSSPLAVFTGGSMLVAGVGRTDLISKELAEPLAHDQFRSVRRIASEMTDDSAVGPTHGAGSFCGSAHTGDSHSTIEKERGRNPALLTDDEERFVRETLAGYRLYPDYYRQMAPVNIKGANAEPVTLPPEASPARLEALSHDHALIDVRPVTDFAAAHVPGSINVSEVASVAVYTGWTLDWDQDFVLIAPDQEQALAGMRSFNRIGMDGISAVVTDGIEAWKAEGRSTGSYRVADFGELDKVRPEVILDVRDPAEYAESSIPGATNIHFSELRSRMGEVHPGAVWVHCQSGFRAAIGASLLSASGRNVVVVNDDIANSKLFQAAC